MYKRLCDYIEYIENATSPENFSKLSEKEREKLKEQLLIQIGFFQHERLIHLIVTHLFALAAMIILVAMVYFKTISMLILFVLLLVLLFPYIIHYYHLENGTQKLYTFYDRFIGETFGDKTNTIAIQTNRRTKGGDVGVRMARKRTQEY